jgi:ribose transport system permease protein
MSLFSTVQGRPLSAYLRAALPVLALGGLLAAVFYRQPMAMSYFGLNLLLNLAIPVAFATMAQVVILAVGDLDLSIGTFVSLTATIGATLLPTNPALAIVVLLALIGVYALAGALVEWRKLPSIVVTLGLSFVWLGCAVLLLPVPGGRAPEWLVEAMRYKVPLAPLPIWVALATAFMGHLVITRSSFGTRMRGLGGHAAALARAGQSLVLLRAQVYALAGFFGVIAGLLLVGQATSADANIASRYTLVSIAAAILGGCEFSGGRVAPAGAVAGALTMTLAASFLTFLNVPSDWQIGVQGAILVLVLGMRAGIDLLEGKK